MSIFQGSGRLTGARGSVAVDWEKVKQEARKNTNIRENYIGQSLKTETSWIFGSDSLKKDDDPQRELAEIRRREAELLHASLNGGIKVGAAKKLTQFEIDELLKKGQLERDEKDGAKMAGLGKRKGGGGSNGVGFDAPQATRLEGTIEVKREVELPRGNVLVDDGKSKAKKDKKKEKKEKKKDKKEKKKSRKKSRSRSRSSGRRRHDSPDDEGRRRHDSPDDRKRRRDERHRHDSPDVDNRRKHDVSVEKKKHDDEKRRRHDSPDDDKRRGDDEKRRRHDSPDDDKRRRKDSRSRSRSRSRGRRRNDQAYNKKLAM